MILVATILYAVAITYTSRQLYRSRKESSIEHVWREFQTTREQLEITNRRIDTIAKIHTDEINLLRVEMKKIGSETINETSKLINSFYEAHRNK